MTWREILLAVLAVYFLYKWLDLKFRVFDALTALDQLPSPHFMQAQAVESLVGRSWQSWRTDAKEAARELRLIKEDALRRREEADKRWRGTERPDDGTPPPPPRP